MSTGISRGGRPPAGPPQGIVVEAVAPGQARTRLTVGPQHLNGHGVVHGGWLFLLADTAFDHACNSHGPLTLARSAEIVFLEPVVGGETLVAEAVERVRRGRNGIYDVTVSRADGTVVALFRGQSATLARRTTEQHGDETP